MDQRDEARMPARHLDRSPIEGADGGGPDGRSSHGGAVDERLAELDLIQSIGRCAAAAGEPRELFAETFSLLLAGGWFDLLGAVHELDGGPQLLVFPGRPLSPAAQESLRLQAERLLPGIGRPQLVELDGYDAARAPRVECGEPELVVAPLVRGGQPAGYVLALPVSGVRENRLRLLFAAVNQISRHLQRILDSREAEADRFRTILESMPQAVIVADDRLRVAQSNRAARRLLRELGLESLDDLRSVIERLGLERMVERERHGGEALADEELAVGGERVFQATVTPLTRGGDAPGLVLVFSEVTESRRLQRRLAQSEKMSSLGQMISGVAHELNNPLATILSYAQLLRDISQDPKQAKRMQVLSEEARRCQRIMQNLLSFARQREPESKPMSLNEVVQSVVQLMRYQLRVADVALEAELDPQLPAMVGDAHQLQQVLVNLVTNARHAIEQTGRAGTILLRTAKGEEATALLEVHDSGVGIPEADRERIFEPFFTTKPEGQGTGLGLALVYGIVTGHGGSLEAVPREGGGTILRIVLPLRSARARADAAPQEEVATSAPRPSRILVVDDEQPLAEVICEALAADGHQAEWVLDGEQALARVESAEFDLVLTDLRMPGMGGAQLVEAIERLRPAQARRVVLTTGDTVSPEAAAVATRTGLALLHKPFHLEELRAVVRTRLARNARSEEVE